MRFGLETEATGYDSCLETNPLNYWERLNCIKVALNGTLLAQSVEAIVPLPRPSVNLEKANRFLPPKPRHFILCERWGDEVEKWKAETYKQNGESVFMVMSRELPPHAQLAESAIIRSLAALGGAWELLVPEATANYLKTIDFESRISAGLEKSEARRIVAQYYSSHHLGRFAAELFGELDVIDSIPLRTSHEIVRRRLSYQKILESLRTPVKEIEEEVTVFLEGKDCTVLQELIAEMMRLGKLRTIPQVLQGPAGLYEATMTLQTRNLLLSELAERK